jgi:hypothetical protein
LRDGFVHVSGHGKMLPAIYLEIGRLPIEILPWLQSPFATAAGLCSNLVASRHLTRRIKEASEPLRSHAFW